VCCEREEEEEEEEEKRKRRRVGAFKECPLLETHCETRCNTIAHPFDPACLAVPRDQLHAEKKQAKWLDGLK